MTALIALSACAAFVISLIRIRRRQLRQLRAYGVTDQDMKFARTVDPEAAQEEHWAALNAQIDGLRLLNNAIATLDTAERSSEGTSTAS